MELYMLIGVPGVGKSTYIAGLTDWLQDNEYVVLSTDDIIAQAAAEIGSTYDEAWGSYIKVAENLMHYQCAAAVADKKIIFWDQTNTTKKGRAKKIKMIPDAYVKHAIVFHYNGDTLAHRLANRPGKTIPIGVLKSMIDHFEFPTLEEGFKDITNILVEDNKVKIL